MENPKDFLERLRAASEPTKRRWIVVITAVVMVAVIYVWLAYFNNLLTAGFSQPAATEQPALPGNGGGTSGSTSFSQTLKNAVANIYGIFGDMFHALGNILNAPREYIIKPPK
jgi:hypothetical protein